MPLRDLIAAMLITNSNELLLYSAVFLGYLLRLGQPLDIPNPIIIDSFTEGTSHLTQQMPAHRHSSQRLISSWGNVTQTHDWKRVWN